MPLVAFAIPLLMSYRNVSHSYQHGPLQNFSHPGDNAIKTADTTEFKPFTQNALFSFVSLIDQC